MHLLRYQQVRNRLSQKKRKFSPTFLKSVIIDTDGLHFFYFDLFPELIFCHILQTGFSLRTYDSEWDNFEWNQDDHMEELWSRGEAGFDLDSFSQSCMILEPDHFQCLFLIMGFIYSLGLIVLLWEILANKKLGFCKLMLYGLFACLLITCTNLFFFSSALWKPITYDTSQESNILGQLQLESRIQYIRTITTGEYEFDKNKLLKNKTVAFAILGYGAVTSFMYIFIAMIKSLGKLFHHWNEVLIQNISIQGCSTTALAGKSCKTKSAQVIFFSYIEQLLKSRHLSHINVDMNHTQGRH